MTGSQQREHLPSQLSSDFSSQGTQQNIFAVFSATLSLGFGQ